SWRPRTCSPYPNAVSLRSSIQNHPTTSARTSNGRSKCVLPKLFPSKRNEEGTMTSSSKREALEDWVARWLKANQDSEKAGDWKNLADFYTDDATYGWNIGPKEDVMCVGKDEIRDVALGLEMEGLENWNYEYQKVLIDEKL